MAGTKSRWHHWWPVGLQKVWKDSKNRTWFIEPNGKRDHRFPKGQKRGAYLHGHTMFPDSDWVTNFESEFKIDDSIDQIYRLLEENKPALPSISRTASLIFKVALGEIKPDDIVSKRTMSTKDHQRLLELLLSLVVRSPSHRTSCERAGEPFGLPRSTEVGKANLLRHYAISKEYCRRFGGRENLFVFLYALGKNSFIFGDGIPAWLHFLDYPNRVDGTILVSLTPRVCVLFESHGRTQDSDYNAISLFADSKIVQEINNLVQVYSKSTVFFYGRAPHVQPFFEVNEFLRMPKEDSSILQMLRKLY